jgi:hypothetical protein
VLRWALYEAAQAAARDRSPDRDYYLQAAERLGHIPRSCPDPQRDRLEQGRGGRVKK